MADFPLFAGQKVTVAGNDTSTSGGALLTASTANAEPSSFTELIASTAEEGLGFWMIALCPSGANQDYLIDVAIGASSAEVEIITDFLLSGASAASGSYSTTFWPVRIPKGSRVSARCRSSTASSTLRLSLYLLHGGAASGQPLGRVTSYGPATADSGGVSVDPGGTANTKNATWTQIVASITNPMRGMVVAFGGQINTVRTTCTWLVDIGVGSAGSEKVKVPNIQLRTNATGDLITPSALGLIPIQVPAGVRLAATAACSTSDATDRLLDVCVYGID